MGSQADELGAEPTNDRRWAAVLDRDASQDGEFVFAVATTGVYCRPSCGARRPRRQNVELFDDAAAAERAGYRACRRCRPDEPPLAERRAAQVAALCRLIEGSEGGVSLQALADHAGWSPSHTHRVFKEVTGLTPKAYALACARERVNEALEAEETVTDAIYSAGYSSSSRFYERATELLGMTASEVRAGAERVEIRFAVGECALGSILVAATDRGVCAILLADEPEGLIDDLVARFPRADLVGADPAFEALVARVVGLVERPWVDVDLPLDIQGTAFQQRVWQALAKIPPGQTVSYGELAAAIGAPKASRAVAQACAANPLAVAIPCHRVVRKDGGLSGYRWGVERKRALLAREVEGAGEG